MCEYPTSAIRLTSLLAIAIQQIATITGTFKDALVPWLGSATNGIVDLFAGNIHAQNKLCVGATCVTEDQFKAMVEGSVLSATTDADSEAAAGTSGSGETEAPSGSSIVNGEKNMDTASSTPNDDNSAATDAPSTAQ
jgi:hypothetical protein